MKEIHLWVLQHYLILDWKSALFSETAINNCYQTALRIIKQGAWDIQKNIDGRRQNNVPEEVEKHPTHNRFNSDFNNRITEKKNIWNEL